MLVVKNQLASEGDLRDAASIPGLGRSPGEGNGYPIQYPGLYNSMDCIFSFIINKLIWKF